MKIQEIIRQKRLEKRLTQEQLAERLGVTAPAVNKWEKGVSYPEINACFLYWQDCWERI